MNDRCDEFVYYRPPLTPAFAALGHDPEGDCDAADPAVAAANTGNRQ